MRDFVLNSYNIVMDAEINPLSKIPHTGARHAVMQILAWMWCIVFSFWVGSLTVFGYTAVAHVLLIGALFATIGAFQTASHNPNALVKGYHTVSRARKHMWVDGKRYDLPDNDPGGEHN